MNSTPQTSRARLRTNAAVGLFLFATVLALPVAAAERGASANQPQQAKPQQKASDQPLYKGVPVFEIGRVDVPPRPTHREPPNYPYALRERRITGEAMVEFVLSTTGKPENVHAISATDPEFGEAAVRAVERWHFSPAKKDGKPVNVQMRVPIVFQLN